jgi:hypothetical protein
MTNFAPAITRDVVFMALRKSKNFHFFLIGGIDMMKRKIGLILIIAGFVPGITGLMLRWPDSNS